jgi:hypothetical protein
MLRLDLLVHCLGFIGRLHLALDGLDLLELGSHRRLDPLELLLQGPDLLLDLALDVGERAVVDVELETLEAFLDGLHLGLDRFEVEFQGLHALEEGLQLGLDGSDRLVVDLDRDQEISEDGAISASVASILASCGSIRASAASISSKPA